MERYSPELEEQMQRYYQSLSKKDRRRYAAIEALKLGHGGISHIAKLFGCHAKPIRRGVAMKEAKTNGNQIQNPTKRLTAAIRKGYKPEKPRQTQPAVSPEPLDESQVPPPGTPEYKDWLDKRTANAPWRHCSSASSSIFS